MYKIKNFKELTEKGVYFKLVTKGDKVIVKRNLLETLLKTNIEVDLPNLYNRIKDFKSNRSNYIELKIEGPMEYSDKQKDSALKSIKELISVNIYECRIEDHEITNGAFKIISKKCVGKYVLTKDGEFVMSKKGLVSNVTLDKILERIIRNITDGKTDLNVLKKLPLKEWSENFAKNGQNIADFIIDLYSLIETDEANKFKHPTAKQALLNTRDFNLDIIKEILNDNELLQNSKNV